MNHIHIDKKYIGFLAGRLKNIQWKNTTSSIASFTHSCERHDSRKRRGYFLLHKGMVFFRCHNCGASMTFNNFIKEEDPNLAAEYRMELFKEGVFGDYKAPEPKNETPKPIVQTETPFSGLVSYKKFSAKSPQMLYLTRRMIPEDRINSFYLAPKFYEWASRFEEVFKKFTEQVPRLIIPYYDENKELLGFACRAFGKENPKYIQLRLDKDKEFLYGLDRLAKDKPIIVVEGQIDSMFLDNAIAVGNANYGSDYLKRNKERIIIVPDNDFRRNVEVCKQLKKAIETGFKVCMLPDSWPKDINDIIKSGIKKETIMEYISTKHKSGPEALLELTLEKRC